VAEFESELICAHTGESHAHAVANGVRLGRMPTLTHHQQLEAIKRLNADKETQGEIARSYNVSRWTISRLAG
jgi:DNA invertase Pin-like site-specific DNA recombinase